MPGLKKILFFIFFFIFLFSGFRFSQYWPTQNYSEINGLPTSFVYDIVQDIWGRIWMATRAGISSYDGVEWLHYNESNGLPVPSFTKIRADKYGRVWAISQPDQSDTLSIVFFDGKKWHEIEKLHGKFPGIYGITSFQLFEEEEEPVLLVGTTVSGVYLWEKGKWNSLSIRDGLSDNRVNGMAVLAGKCYIATDGGLSILNRDKTIDNPDSDLMPFSTKEIKGIFVEENGESPRIWLFGDGQLGHLNRNNDKPVLYDTGITFSKKEEPVKLLPDYCCGIYIGNIYELFYFNFNTRKTQRLSVTNGLLGVGVNTMINDFEKNIWLSCDRGVSKIASRRFGSFTMLHGLLEDEVTAVLEYEPGKFVLGHNNGVTFYDNGRFQKLPFFPDSEFRPQLCRVLEIKSDSKQNIWAASSFMGLARINKQKEIRWYGTEQGLPERISCLWIDAQDNIWMGTTQGIFCLDKNGRVSNKSGEFPLDNYRRIFAEKGKLTYLATQSAGFYAYEENRWNHYRSKLDAGANGVYAIKKDRSGRLLIGTAAGLYVLEQGVINKFTVRDFDLKRPIYFIIEDERQRLWFGTDNGVVRWDGSREIKYTTTDGLIGQETNRAAGIIDSSGKIWIGTNRGVSIYDDDFDNYNAWIPPPKVRLLHIEVDQHKFMLDRPIKLSYKNRSILFYFRGISFINEKAIRFKHKLEGFDEEWSKEQYHYYQFLEYTNPKPGRYRFLIKAKNSMGIWSDVVFSPEIVILKPFYNKWWFYLFLIACSGLIFYGFFYFFSTRRTAAMLENLVEERTGQLRATEKRYRDLFEDTRDVVLLISRDEKILDINPAGAALLGYKSKEEAMALDVKTDFYYNQADRPTFLNEIRKKGFVKDYELNLKRKDGEKIIVLVTASLVSDQKSDVGSIRGILRDITEKKKLQQQLEQSQKMEAIGTLAGGIAHDFNNILGVISGYLDLTIAELPKDSTARQNIERIISSTNRARDLVKQILTFSRQDAQELKPLRVSSIIIEALKLLRSTIPSTIEIRQDIKAETGIILAEPTHIHQVIMNLCTNAAHAMREAGGVLDIRLNEVELDKESAAAYNDIAPGRYLRLTVGDTGHGIEPAVIKRIFDPYFTTKNPGEGTGMGLAVIHGIVKSLKGEITVYSEPGRGTTFHILFPAAASAEGVNESGKFFNRSVDEEYVSMGSGEQLLLVDDEPLLVIVGQRLLEMLGYRVTTSTNGIEALAEFRAEPEKFDLVITDFTMPKMTGVQLAKQLKEIRPDIPIILCTGFSEMVTPEQIKKLGIRKLMMKPIDRHSLARAIREALKNP